MTEKNPRIVGVRRYPDEACLLVQAGQCPVSGHGTLVPGRSMALALDNGVGGWCPACGWGWAVPVAGCLYRVLPPLPRLEGTE